jgi:GTPase
VADTTSKIRGGATVMLQGSCTAESLRLKMSKPAETRAGRVALVGAPNVGKSTLLNALLGEPIAITSPHPQTTRESVRGVLTVRETQYVFVDTPGLHVPRTQLGRRMNENVRLAVRDADAIVLLVESPRHGQRPGPREADLELAAELPRGPTVLAINKIDRLKDRSLLLPFMASFNERCAFAATVPLSAKRADGIDALLREIGSLLPEQPFLFDAETLSDQPVRFFVAEFVREQVLQHTKQEVPHGVAVVVEQFEEGELPHIEVTVHVARESHKKIVIGAQGRMLKAIGTAARVRVEQMLSRRVHLKLRVCATPGWMNDDVRLRELGYGGPETKR